MLKFLSSCDLKWKGNYFVCLEFSFHDSSYYTAFSLSPHSSVFCGKQKGKNYEFQKLHYPLVQDYGLKKMGYNHGQKSLGESERNFNSMCFTSSVAKSRAVFLQIHVPSPLPTQYNVERWKELCLDGFNTLCGVGGGGRDVLF